MAKNVETHGPGHGTGKGQVLAMAMLMAFAPDMALVMAMARNFVPREIQNLENLYLAAAAFENYPHAEFHIWHFYIWRVFFFFYIWRRSKF